MLGLSDVTPVKEAVVAELTKRTLEMVQNMDADKMMDQWMTISVQGIGDIQKAFMEQFAKAQWSAGGARAARKTRFYLRPHTCYPGPVSGPRRHRCRETGSRNKFGMTIGT